MYNSSNLPISGTAASMPQPRKGCRYGVP